MPVNELFSRNLPTLTEAEQTALAEKRVFLAGCGGLGGFVSEFLVRAGVGHITAADCDRFSPTNRNRQLLSLESTEGRSKVRSAAARARDIHPGVDFRPVEARLDSENLPALLAGCELAMDALDNVPARLALEDACAAAGIPLVHGAVQGWAAQAAVALPGSGLLHTLYAGAAGKTDSSVLSPVPAMCAAVQCAEAIKLLLGRPSELAGKLLLMDLRGMDFTVIEL